MEEEEKRMRYKNIDICVHLTSSKKLLGVV